MRNNRLAYALRVVVAAMSALGSAAQATCPLFDRVEYNGESLVVPAGTAFPPSQRYEEWARTFSRCSAQGQGRPRYKVAEGSVFLVEFYACGSVLRAAEAYGTGESEVPAVWLNGQIVAFSSIGYCPFLDKKAPVHVFSVAQGKVVSVKTEPRTQQ